MRHFTKILFAAVLSVLGVLNVNAVKADLDPAMFKAWDGFGKDANVVAEPEPCPNSDGSVSYFGCDFNLYEELGAGGMVYGNTNVYYLWYADVTGTQTITFQGTPGLQIRVLMNRPAPEEGGDPHGGQTVEQNLTLDAEGVATLDVSGMEFVHINAIKLGWGSPTGVIRKVELEGSVKPVTGWVDMINNGDFEGDDLESFPVSKNGPNNGNTANDRPEIVEGAGPDGSRAAKVTSDANASETWSTQFYIKPTEGLAEGTQWRLTMDIKAARPATITTSAQGRPRDWQSGFENENSIGNFEVQADWNTYEFSGTVTHNEAFGNNGIGALGSIAFDLNNDKDTPNDFYFDNISFQIYMEATPLSQIKTAYGADVVRVEFGKASNIKELVTAAGGERLVYPNECATVTVNGQPTTLMSVEGRPDGYLYIFIDEGYPEGEGEDVVAVSFTNPEDAAHRIVFASGKYEGEAAPNFKNMEAEYMFELSEYYSYLYGAPVVVKADPEDGGFNLPNDLKEFKFTFDHPVDVAAMSAKLDTETLTVSPAEGFEKDIVLTRTGEAPLADGVHILTLLNVKGEKDLGEDPEPIVLTLSVGPVVVDPNDQPKDMIPVSYFNDCAAGNIPEGYIVQFGSEAEPRQPGSSQGSGSRMMSFPEGGDFTRGLYFREGYVQYGTVENYTLALEAGKKYKIHFNSAMWKDNGSWMKFEILNEAGEAVFSQMISNNPNVNGNTSAAVNGSTSTDIDFVPEADGTFTLKWTSSNANGDDNVYSEVLLANTQMKYVPSVAGVEELALVNTALENAKKVYANNDDARFAGEAFTTLAEVIKKYDGVTFTAPSVCRAAAAELDAAAKAMTDHRTACDTYDQLPPQAQELVDNYAASKFAKSEFYPELKAIAAKYILSKSTVTPEESEEPVVVYDFKKLTDDAELAAAIEELQSAITYAKAMFTEGPSAIGEWSATRSGYAVLIERLRLGAEALKALGVDETNPAIVAANNALSDDDAMAELLKNLVKAELYGQLKDGKKIFEDIKNPGTEEEEVVAKTLDLSVFVKNPNLYKLPNLGNNDAVPGWDVVDGRGFSPGWDGYNPTNIPVDVAFSNWGGSFTVSQTIEDLPAGVYTLSGAYGERDNEASAEGSYFFVIPSSGDSLKVACPVIGQAFPNYNCPVENVVIVDGKVTLGVQAGAASHVFFDKVQILMTAPADGFDYAKAYEETLTGIDVTKAQTATVRAIQLFDLNGRRISTAKKGVVIVRKLMSDGTMRTEKVVVK